MSALPANRAHKEPTGASSVAGLQGAAVELWEKRFLCEIRFGSCVGARPLAVSRSAPDRKSSKSRWSRAGKALAFLTAQCWHPPSRLPGALSRRPCLLACFPFSPSHRAPFARSLLSFIQAPATVTHYCPRAEREPQQ